MDLKGTDLQVNRRYGRTIVKLQVRGRAFHNSDGRLQFNMNKSDIPPEDAKYVVVPECFPKTATFGRFVWIIYSYEVRRVARSNGKQWSGTLSTQPESKDEWTPFRDELTDIAAVTSALLERNERGEAPLRTAAEVRAALPAPREAAPPPKVVERLARYTNGCSQYGHSLAPGSTGAPHLGQMEAAGGASPTPSPQ